MMGLISKVLGIGKKPSQSEQIASVAEARLIWDGVRYDVTRIISRHLGIDSSDLRQDIDITPKSYFLRSYQMFQDIEEEFRATNNFWSFGRDEHPLEFDDEAFIELTTPEKIERYIINHVPTETLREKYSL